MSDAVTIALISGLPSILASLAVLIRLFKVDKKVGSTHAAIELLEKNTNSIKDALVKVTGESERAKGKLEGAAEEVVRSNEARGTEPS